MALLTPMTLEQARRLGAAYGLEVVGREPIAVGINSNFVLSLKDGRRAFARVCETGSRADIEAQGALLEHLAVFGVPTPRPYCRLDGIAVSEHRTKPVMVFPFCRGQSLCQAAVTPAHMAQMGRALALLHAAGESYRYRERTAFDLPSLTEQVRELEARELPVALRDDLALMAKRLEALTRNPLPDPVAPTIVHGDLFRDNVLWEGEQLSALLDFEFASQGSPLFDLMVTMLSWCFGSELEPSLARAFVASYRSERSLGDGELAACYSQALQACLRFAISRITDYELKPRERIAYKDYRRFLARLCAVESLGPHRFADWLTGG